MALATLGSYTFSDGDGLSYETSGKFLVDFKLGGTKQEVEKYSANGVNGFGTKRHGKREAQHTLSCVVIAATETGAFQSGLEIINDLASGDPFAYAVGGETGTARILAEQSAVSQPRSTGLGTFRAECVIVIEKLRS